MCATFPRTPSAGQASTTFISEQLSALLTALAPAAAALNLTVAAASGLVSEEVRHQVQAHATDRVLRGQEASSQQLQQVQHATDRVLRGQEASSQQLQQLLGGQEALNRQVLQQLLGGQEAFNRQVLQQLAGLALAVQGNATRGDRGGVIPSPASENQGANAKGIDRWASTWC